MRINTNIMALNAQNKLSVNQRAVESSIGKLSSGMRINTAADDAAGLAISEKMRSQIRGLNQARANAQDGISMLQTAEGALQQTTDILQRMRELIVKSQNSGVLSSTDTSAIEAELSSLKTEVDRIATSATFNSRKILNGSIATKATANLSGTYDVSAASAKPGTSYTIAVDGTKATMTCTGGTETITLSSTISGVVRFSTAGIQINVGEEEVAIASIAGTITTQAASNGERIALKIGANIYAEDTIYLGIDDMSTKGLTKDNTNMIINVRTDTDSDAALKTIDYAINKVSNQRATIGAVQNRLEYSMQNLATTSENLSTAESRIRDVDMAAEMVNYTNSNILNQSAMAMLAQANQQPQQILTLLQ